MKTRNRNRAADPTGQTQVEGSGLNNPQVGQTTPTPTVLKLTRREYSNIPRDYKSWWARPDGSRVRVVLRGCPTGGVTLVEVEITKD